MKNRLSILLLSVLFAFSACMNQQKDAQQATSSAAPSPEETNKKAYREIVRAFETGNVDSLGNYVTENFVNHGDSVPGITSTGLQNLKDRIASYRASFPDLNIAYHSLVADGDLLIAYATWQGTNTGEMMGSPATNKPAKVQFAEAFRFENGKAAEGWEVMDNVAFMTQLGFMPQQGAAPAEVATPNYDWNTATAANDSASNAREAKMKEAYDAVMSMIESGDFAQLDQYMAADFKEHQQIPGVTLPDGVEGARQAMTMLKQMYPDMNMTVNKIAAEGDFLIAYITVEGTFAGGVPGFPAEATGKKVKVDAFDIVQFNGEGKATAHWAVNDTYGELIQLGVIPAPQPPADGQAAAK